MTALLPRAFSVVAEAREVPAVAWVPDDSLAAGRHPLVLLGHGGSGSKLTVAPLAQRIVADFGAVVAAIDGPVHGDRRAEHAPPEQVLADFRELWRQGTPRIAEMVSDWRATLDELVSWPEIDDRRVGWCGVSMGTAYGLPFVAADDRVGVAVLGMWGLSYPNTERLASDAPQVKCPVLFQRKADDELFTVDGQEELFSLLGSGDKELRVYPGRHGTPAPAQIDHQIAFLNRYLTN